MADENPEIEDNPKAALASFITELETFYYSWYDTETDRAYYLWIVFQWIALLSGFGTALLAALLKEDQLVHWGVGRIALIVMPILGSLASTYIVQSRIADVEALREAGRETVQRLANQARVDFAAATTPEKFTEIHQGLVVAISALEKEQSRGFHRIAPKVITTHSPRRP